MINKLITSDSYDFGDMATRLVPLHRGGVDSQWMRKHASADIFAKELASLKPTPGRTILHIIALGDEERYGANRNCDAFAREDNIKAHHLFKDIGKVYRNHKNDDPSNNFGDVLATAHNDQMSRVELLVSLINKLCPDEVEAVNSGKDVPFSMGCFTAGHLVTLEDGTQAPLETLEKGQIVLTHTGSLLPVKQRFYYDYTGKLYRLSAATLLPIEATEEHPFFIIPREAVMSVSRKVQRVVQDLDKTSPAAHAKWVHAKDLRKGDYLLTPVPMQQETPDYFSVPLMRLLGYYAAEGHTRLTPEGRYCSICLTVNKDDAAVTEVPQMCAELGIPKDRIHVRPCSHSDKCLSITITDSWLAYQCVVHAGTLAKSKRLSYELMHARYDYQLSFLGALLNGDGCRGTGSQAGAIYLSTASPFYRDQIRTLLARVGIVPGCNTLKHRPGAGKSTYSTIEYQVYIPKTDAWILHPFTVKGDRVGPSSRRGGKRIKWCNYILTPIDNIEVREVENERVHNIEVLRDNSYTVNSVAVHNSSQEYDVCSYCQHKAPTSQDHCFHIKNALGEILKDGTKIYMKNPNPRFFDISIVYKPADRIAYSLRKVAGTVVGGHDLAEMYGLTPAKLTKRATMQALAEIMKEIPAVARKVAVPRSVCADTKQELSKLAKAYGISQLIGCLTKRGFLLSPEDFAEVATGQKVAAVDDVCGCGLNDIIDDRQEIEAFDPPIAQDNIPLSASAVNDLETNCSMSEGPMRKRVMIIIMKPQPKVASVGDPTEIHGLSMLYKHYKVAFAHAHRSNPALVRAVASTF